MVVRKSLMLGPAVGGCRYCHSLGFTVFHYLDDFFTAGPANSSQCSENLQSMFTLCSNINAPIKLSKVEGPTKSLTFLGIHLNSNMMEASISDERKQALLSELTRKRC